MLGGERSLQPMPPVHDHHIFCLSSSQFKVPGEDGSPRLFSELVELLVEMEAGAGRDWRLVLALLCALAE